MVDHEIPAWEIFAVPEDMYSPVDAYHYQRRRRYSSGEDLKEERDLPTKEFCRSTSLRDAKFPAAAERWSNERIREKLLKVSRDLLECAAEYEFSPAAQDMKSIEIAYKNETEKFLIKISDFLRTMRQMRVGLTKSLREFQWITRTAAQVTLAASATNVALVLGSLAHKLFRFSWSPKVSNFYYVVGALSFTSSLLTLSYMKRSTNEMSREVGREGRRLVELVKAHRKGDWVDAEVSRFFPFGINLNLIEKNALQEKNFFHTKYVWKTYVCSAVILSNIQKDAKLLYDTEFLTRVKIFVENPAAEIWWNRLKLKKMLEDVRKKADDASFKVFLSAHEDLIHRTAQYLYPLIIPWLVSSWNTEEMMFVCNSFAGIIAAVDLSSGSQGELRKLKEISRTFDKDIKEINSICKILNSSDD